MTKVRTKATRKKRERAPRAPENKRGVYRGKQAKTGNSLGLRFERALFHSHPEFNGEVEAYAIGPGRMLVVAEPDPRKKSAEEDPVLSSFVSFWPLICAIPRDTSRPFTATFSTVLEHL